MRRAAVAVLVALALATAAPATADDGRVGLSQDGTAWTSQLRTPVLADAPARWVPGDTASGSLLVRNQGPSAATVAVGLTAPDTSRLLRDLRLAVTVRGRTVTVPADRLATGLGTLAPGSYVPVAVQVRLVASSPNATQRSDQDLGLRVVLTEDLRGDGTSGGDPAGGGSSAGGGQGADAGADAEGAPDPAAADPSAEPAAGPATQTQDSATAPLGSGGPLPGTGAPVGAWTVWVAAGAIGVGSAILTRRRGRA